MHSAWLLPEHFADVLPAQARRIEELRRQLLDLASCHGFELVMPPLVEHLDSLLSGTGELIEPDDGILAVGSGGTYALAAARALLPDERLSARQIVERSLGIAAEICVYTNTSLTILELPQ